MKSVSRFVFSNTRNFKFRSVSWNNAGCADLMAALKYSGPGLPRKITDRLVGLEAPDELRTVLTDDFDTWGDIWAVELMGRIGDASLVPELIAMIRNFSK